MMLPLVGCEFGQIVDLVRLDHVVFIGLPGLHPFFADLRIDGARFGDVLGAGDLGGLAEDAVDTLRNQLVVHVADRRTGPQSRGGVALAAFSRHPQIGNVAFLALQFRRPLQIVLGDARCLGDRHQIAGAFDAEAGHRLAGLLDAVDDALGPAFLDADHHDRGDIGIGAGADQRAEKQIEVGAELQPAIGVRNGERALDLVGDQLAGGVGNIVERQNDHVIAHADAAVFAPPAHEFHVRLAVAFSHVTTAWS